MNSGFTNMCMSKYVEHLDDASWTDILQDTYNLPRNLFILIHNCQLSDWSDFHHHDLYDYWVNQPSFCAEKSLND